MGASAMIAMSLALLGAVVGTELPKDSLVVFAREPVCHMGRTSADGTMVRFEYHPLDDSYHLLVSGPSVRSMASDASPLVVIKSGFDRFTFRSSVIRGNPDHPAAVYAPLSYPQRSGGSELTVQAIAQKKAPRNMAIEQRLFDPRGLQLLVDDRLVADFGGDVASRASGELVRCGNRFAKGGATAAAARAAKFQRK